MRSALSGRPVSELHVAIAAVLVTGVAVAIPAVDADGPSFAFHWSFLVARFPFIGQGALPCFHHRENFPRGPLTKLRRAERRFLQMRERNGRQDVPERQCPREGLERRGSAASATEQGRALASKIVVIGCRSDLWTRRGC